MKSSCTRVPQQISCRSNGCSQKARHRRPHQQHLRQRRHAESLAASPARRNLHQPRAGRCRLEIREYSLSIQNSVRCALPVMSWSGCCGTTDRPATVPHRLTGADLPGTRSPVRRGCPAAPPRRSRRMLTVVGPIRWPLNRVTTRPAIRLCQNPSNDFNSSGRRKGGESAGDSAAHHHHDCRPPVPTCRPSMSNFSVASPARRSLLGQFFPSRVTCSGHDLTRMHVHLDHAWIRSDRERRQPVVRGRQIAFQHHPAAGFLGGLLDRGEQIQPVLDREHRRQKHMHLAVARRSIARAVRANPGSPSPCNRGFLRHRSGTPRCRSPPGRDASTPVARATALVERTDRARTTARSHRRPPMGCCRAAAASRLVSLPGPGTFRRPGRTSCWFASGAIRPRSPGVTAKRFPPKHSVPGRTLSPVARVPVRRPVWNPRRGRWRAAGFPATGNNACPHTPGSRGLDRPAIVPPTFRRNRRPRLVSRHRSRAPARTARDRATPAHHPRATGKIKRPSRQLLTRILLAHDVLQSGAGSPAFRKPAQQPVGVTTLGRSSRVGVPLRRVQIRCRNERRLAAHRQPDIPSCQRAIHRGALIENPPPLIVGIRLRDPRRFQNAADRHFHGERGFAFSPPPRLRSAPPTSGPGLAASGICPSPRQQPRGRVEPDPARARQVNFAPRMQIDEVGRRTLRPLKRPDIRRQLHQITRYEPRREAEVT